MAERYVFRPRRPLYVFLRCRNDLDDDREDAANDAADEMFRELRLALPVPIDDAELMAPEEDYYTLGNGLVVRIKTERSCAEVADGWKQHLRHFAAWAIHDGKSDVVEGGDSIGQVKSALGAVRFSSRDAPVTQAFLVYRDPDKRGSADAGEITDRVCAMWPGKLRSAFPFSNGRAVFVSPEHPAESLIRGMELIFPRERRRLFHEAVFDNGGGGSALVYFGDADGWTPYTY